MAAATALPTVLGAAAPAPQVFRRALRPVRARGVVRSAGRPLAGVAVSDGLSVVESAADGTFEILSSLDREFVHVSLPAGQRIPRNPSGTARLYRRLTPDARGEAEAVFELEPLHRSDERHTLLLLPDIQIQDEQDTKQYFEQSVPDVRAVVDSLGDREILGIACGDIMYDRLELYTEYERSVRRMGVPFFQVVGNHDLDMAGKVDEASTVTFSRHFGPRHYSFDRGAVHYVVLDDVFWHGQGYLGYLDADQLTWLAADLARIEPGRTVIVALHIPVLGSRHTRDGRRRPAIGASVTNREALFRLLEPFRAHVLAGHIHENEHLEHDGVHEHVCGAVCGAWWTGPICADGTPAGYAVYDVDGEAVSWRYKCTGRPFDHQMRTYALGADPDLPERILANVWDWDPRWSVVWYEDGERRGAMSRRTGRDPWSVALHEGPDLPERRSWVEPYATAHLFHAPASRRARRITVEATDRFGRTYSAEVARDVTARCRDPRSGRART